MNCKKPDRRTSVKEDGGVEGDKESGKTYLFVFSIVLIFDNVLVAGGCIAVFLKLNVLEIKGRIS